jgi:putative FmdB family regulatory protein
MPIREYECKDCQIEFENIELAGEPEKVTCPRCQSQNVEKKFSLFAHPNDEGSSCTTTRGFG